MAGTSNCFATDLMPLLMYMYLSLLVQTGIFFEDTIYFSGTAQEDVGNIKLIEEYIVSMATTVDNNRWFWRSA